MDYYICCLFLFLGIISPFLLGIISYLSQEKILEIIDSDYKSAQFLRKIKSEFDYDFNGFILIELIFYFISLSFLVSKLHNDNVGYTNFIITLTSFIIAALLFRTLFKSLGIRKSESYSLKFIWLIKFYYILAYPFVFILNPLRIAIEGVKDAEESRDEISELVETAHEEGAIDQGEYRILKNIMNFSEVLITDVMTPRTVIFSCEADKTVDEVVNLPELHMYSRFPIWEGESIDDGVLGYVMSKDVLIAALKGKGSTTLRDFCREVYFIPESAQLDTALERFLNRRQHLFVVVDEYGGIEGLISMEDVLETILGTEILDEVDKVADLRQLAKQRRDSRIASLN